MSICVHTHMDTRYDALYIMLSETHCIYITGRIHTISSVYIVMCIIYIDSAPKRPRHSVLCCTDTRPDGNQKRVSFFYRPNLESVLGAYRRPSQLPITHMTSDDRSQTHYVVSYFPDGNLQTTAITICIPRTIRADRTPSSPRLPRGAPVCARSSCCIAATPGPPSGRSQRSR